MLLVPQRSARYSYLPLNEASATHLAVPPMPPPLAPLQNPSFHRTNRLNDEWKQPRNLFVKVNQPLEVLYCNV